MLSYSNNERNHGSHPYHPYQLRDYAAHRLACSDTSLKAFLDIMWHNAIHVGVYGEVDGTYATPEDAKERREVFRKAIPALEKELPTARTALENEFRKLLGVEN